MTEKNTVTQPEKKVEQLIFRDDLTGAFNRRYLYQFLPQEISRCKMSNQNLWLFMIDVDNFKSINDTYGHLMGDGVLKGVVNILKESVRPGDTVARYAGDEFTVIISSTDVATANAVASRIMTKVSQQTFKAEGGRADFKVNLSIGVANFPEDASEAVQLIDMADKALYVSKEKGKNRVSYVSDLSIDVLVARVILEIFPCPKMVERERQLQELMGFFERIRNEKKVQTVLISGATGTGKNRLIEEFLKLAKSQGSTALMDRCIEQSSLVPFRSALGGVEKFLKKSQLKKEVLLEGFSQEELAVLGKISSSLKMLFDIKEDKGPETKEGLDTLILQALSKIFINISKQNKLCMVIDDFHWIDIGSLNLISALKERDAEILIVGLLREGELSRQPTEIPLSQFKEDLNRFFSGKILIENLSSRGTGEMITQIFSGLDSDVSFLELIYKVTRGNPLFIEELLKLLAQRGFLFYQKGKWSKVEVQESDLPHSLEEVILERIKTLDKPTQQIIAKAAVIGQDFSTEMLQKLDKEDEGYILDILESAKKVGLIKETRGTEEETPSGEEMSFVNEEVRRAVSDLIGQEEVKNLHHQIGEIEENLNASNLEDVAGELLYHFKKAQDFGRIKRYADLLKESEGFLQDQTVEYAKQILEEKEEKVNSLSKRSQKLVPDIIRLLYVIQVNASLYPQGSEMVTSFLEELFRKFSEVFTRDGTVLLSEYKDALLVNGEKLKEMEHRGAFSENLLSLFKSNYLESVSFKRGLSKNELKTFIENFGVARDDRSLSEILKSKFVFKIKVKEIGIPSEKEKSAGPDKISETNLIDQLLGKGAGAAAGTQDILNRFKDRPEEMARLITQHAESIAKDKTGEKDRVRAETVAESIQKISEKITTSNEIGEVDKYKKGLAAAIMKLEPSKLRKDVLLSDRFDASKNDIIKEIAPYFSDDMISELFIEEFLQNKASSSRLKALVMRFLSDTNQKKRLSPMLKDKLDNAGLPKEDSAWIFGDKKWQDFGLEERLNKFLQMSAKDYLSLEEVDVKTLVAEIIEKNRPDLLVKFLDKWKEFLGFGELNLRRLIALNLASIIDTIPVPKHEGLLEGIIDFVLSQIQKETHSEIYSILVSQLSRPVDCLLSLRSFRGLKLLLERLEKERGRFDEGMELRSIQTIYEKVSDKQFVKTVIDELVTMIDKNLSYSDILDIIVLIGDAMVEPLMQEAMVEDRQLHYLGYFGVYLRRRAIGEVLVAIAKRNGYEAISQNLKERFSSEQGGVVRNAIDLVMYLQEPQMGSLLSQIINHPDTEVRKKVTLALAKFPTPENLQLLNKMLSDDEKEVRLNVINLLGKVGNKSSLAILKNLNDPENQEVLRASIDTLEKKVG